MRLRTTALIATSLLTTGLLAAGTATPSFAAVSAPSTSPLLARALTHSAQVTAAGTETCADFDYWEEATLELLNFPEDVVPGIDTDGDGLACEDVRPESPDDHFSPEGSLDAATGGANTISVSGWVIDPDSLFRADTVHVYVDGGLAGVFTADGNRPDLATAFHVTDDSTVNLGTHYGYAGSVPAVAGKHRVCVYGIDSRALARNTTLGCSAVTVTAADIDPHGSVDVLNFFADGRPVLYGWSADPDDLHATLAVHVYVDGKGVAITATGTSPRPDVAARTGAPDAGWLAILPNPGPGKHTACAYGINVGPGANSLLGCKAFG